MHREEHPLTTPVPDPSGGPPTGARQDEPTDILVVDDLADKLFVYRTVLENPELNIVTARSGAEALREVLQREFAVILLDVNMPGMDGFETAQLIRQRRRSASTPIIFLTAFNDDVRMSQGYASGAVDYIATPVVPEILKAKVQVFVELFRMRRLTAEQAEERAKRALAEVNAQRSAFMAEAGAALSRSLDMDSLLDAIVQAPIPFLADVCVLHIADGPGNDAGFLTAWHSGGFLRADGAREGCPWPWLAHTLRRATVNEHTRLLEPLPRTRTSGDIPDIEGGQAIILPLRTRENPYGALALVRRTGATPYSPEELTLAREFASRGGIALENARLVQGIQEADRRKDEFLGMLAHELRNPLAPLRNAVDILEMNGEPDKQTLADACGVIDRQVRHMTRLVDDLLDATRIARGKVLLRKERCDLGVIVQQTASDYRNLFEEDGITFTVEVPERACYVHGDPTRLSQTVGNLLHNAHKFTDMGGSVTIRLQVQDSEGWASVIVTDTGMGIDPAMLPHVFDVFRQADQGLDRSRGGLGLGLTLVKGLVELHNGNVSADSTGAGGGSRFTIRLPLRRADTPVPHTAAPAQPPGTQRLRILVIDDNRDAAEMMKLVLQRDGHEVRTAYTGPAGMEQVHAFRPKVVVCDIGLPGMNGYEVARAVRRDLSSDEVHLIAVTGYGREEDRVNAREAGFEVHLTKPVDLSALRQALVTVTEQAAG